MNCHILVCLIARGGSWWKGLRCLLIGARKRKGLWGEDSRIGQNFILKEQKAPGLGKAFSGLNSSEEWEK